MGNHASCVVAGNHSEKTIQVVCSDGTVRILHKTVSAGQIMQEFTQHLICHSDSFYIGQKTQPLSQNDKLKVGNKYFLLPHQFFQTPFSLVSLASLISPTAATVSTSPTACVSSPLRNIGREAALCQPFEMEKSNVGGGLRIRVSADFITKIMNAGRLNSDEGGLAVVRDDELRGLCNTPQLQKDYAQLVTAREQSWKPKLESIREKERPGGYMRFMKIKRSGKNSS